MMPSRSTNEVNSTTACVKRRLKLITQGQEACVSFRASFCNHLLANSVRTI